MNTTATRPIRAAKGDTVQYDGKDGFLILNGSVPDAKCKIETGQAVVLDGKDAALLHYGGWHWSFQMPEAAPHALKEGATFTIQ